jgi:hypothetical protein
MILSSVWKKPQNMYKNLVVFGCSYTKDNYQASWAQLLADDYNLKLYNYAERGAGADYVVRRLLVSDIDPTESIVVILWPSADRYDLWSDETTAHLVQDIQYASWPDGVRPRFVDYHGEYREDKGFNLNGSVPRGYKHKFYKYFYSPHAAVHNWYVNIITAQLYLKTNGIRHLMSSAFPLTNPLHYHQGPFDVIDKIYNQIDLSTFVPKSETQGFYGFCIDNNLPFCNCSPHPTTESHRKYVDDVLKFEFNELLK